VLLLVIQFSKAKVSKHLISFWLHLDPDFRFVSGAGSYKMYVITNYAYVSINQFKIFKIYAAVAIKV
jgi:hypothetical protein